MSDFAWQAKLKLYRPLCHCWNKQQISNRTSVGYLKCVQFYNWFWLHTGWNCKILVGIEYLTFLTEKIVFQFSGMVLSTMAFSCTSVTYSTSEYNPRFNTCIKIMHSLMWWQLGQRWMYQCKPWGREAGCGWGFDIFPCPADGTFSQFNQIPPCGLLIDVPVCTLYLL